MTIKERLSIIGSRLFTKSAEATVIDTDKEKVITAGGVISLPNLVDQKRASTKLLEANKGWVFKNNDVIAKEVGTIEFELYSMRVVGQEIILNPITSHPILSALDKFNEFTSKSDGFYNTCSHKNLAGDSFWLIEGNGANVQNIFLLQPDKVELGFGDRIAGQKIISNYKFQDTIDGEFVKETYDADDIVHFKNPDPANPYRGKSRVEAAAEAIDTDNYATEANKLLYQRGLITNFVLTTEGNLTNDQILRLQRQLKSKHGGIANAYESLILSGGLKPYEVQQSNRDAQFIEQQRWQRDKIMSIFGNTLSVLGIVEDVNRANADATILNWKRTTIKAEMKNLTNTLNEFFVPRFGSNLILTFKDPVPEDRQTLINEATSLRSAKIISPNEARELLGYDPSKDPNADMLSDPVPDFIPDLPKSVKNIDYMRFMRKTGVLERLEKNIKHQELVEKMRPVAKKMIADKKAKEAKPEVKREHEVFSNDKVWDYTAKQMSIVEAAEQAFANKVEQFIGDLIERGVSRIPEETVKMQTKALFDLEEEIVRAEIDFTPLLKEVAIQSGQQALNLVGEDKPYLALGMDTHIKRNVRKFAKSMIKTDRDKMIDIISQGIAEGQSVPAIQASVLDTFEDYSKVQAERVTRSEVIRASNQGAVDAWRESDAVVAKQWLTAEDDRVDGECEEMNGKIIGLESNFNSTIRDLFESDMANQLLDYGAVEEPPLHPNCRCTLLPVLEGEKNFDARHFVELRSLKQKVESLETEMDSMDKRTKEYKQALEKQKAYVEELEEYLEDE